MKSVAALIFAALLLSPAAALADEAADAVRALYERNWNPLADDDWNDVATGAALSAFEKNDALSIKNEGLGCIDFVPTFSGQDYDEAEVARSLNLRNTGAGGDGDEEIAASFTNFGQKTTVLWTMRKTDGVWKIADIANPPEWRLSEFDCE